MNVSKLLAAAALLAGAVASTGAEAHGIWFAQRATQLALIYGVGADDLDSVKRLPLIKSVAAYDSNWKAVPANLRPAGPLLLVDTDGTPTVVTAVLENGTWSKTPDGAWHRKGRDEVPNATISETTIKYAVVIRGPLTSQLPALPDQTLQVVPIEPTLPALLGKSLKLRVLFKGKPVAGALVKNDYVNDPDSEGVKSAADGSVTIVVRNQGLNVVVATFDGPADDPAKADKTEHLASLSFVLPHAPE